MKMPFNLLRLKEIVDSFSKGFKDSSVRVIEMELKEMENAFALILLGSLIGIPSPLNYLSFSLLPYIERELKVMIVRSETR